jgi:protein SCO1/2
MSLSLVSCEQNQTASSGQVTSIGSASIGGPFDLINQDGQAVTDQDILGQPQLIYFGFSYCPDVCPLALQQMGQALSEIDTDGKIFKPIFISVDPERDTPEALKLYVTSNGFPKNLVGLTGSLEQVERAKKAYKIYAAKAEDPESTAGYTVDHASIIYVMDANGEFLDAFTHETQVPEMVSRLRHIKKNLD